MDNETQPLSPMQSLNKPKDTSQSINESTDTVYGQLQKHTSQDNPLLQRVAMKANEKSAERGLTNSSIAIGNAQGAVIDRAGDFAKTDAEIYSRRKDQNQQADVHLENARMGNATTLTQQQMSNDAQLRNTNLQITSTEKLAGERQTFEGESLAKELASKENIAGMNIQATAQQSALERQNRQFLEQMGNDSAARIAQLKEDSQDFRQRYDAGASAWDNLQQGISQINPAANAASQRTQFNRLQESFRSRMTFLNTIGGSTPNETAPTGGSTVASIAALAPNEAAPPPPAPTSQAGIRAASKKKMEQAQWDYKNKKDISGYTQEDYATQP
jgi:hypothetical protein